MTGATRAILGAAVAVGVLGGCVDASEGATSTDAAGYCADSGGTVQQRQPMFGTNNDPATWEPLGEPVDVCRFVADDDSRIYVDLVTLSSQRPTLAALAYLARTPVPQDARGNPAAALCAELGGASGYGTSVNGGGLVAQDDPVDDVIVPCTFADQSFVEEWGIAYYAGGTVRGADLATLFQFDTSDVPPVFGR